MFGSQNAYTGRASILYQLRPHIDADTIVLQLFSTGMARRYLASKLTKLGSTAKPSKRCRNDAHAQTASLTAAHVCLPLPVLATKGISKVSIVRPQSIERLWSASSSPSISPDLRDIAFESDALVSLGPISCQSTGHSVRPSLPSAVQSMATRHAIIRSGVRDKALCGFIFLISDFGLRLLYSQYHYSESD